MTKLEGTQFLYDVMNDMGIDNLDIADLELVIAVVKRIEKK